MKRHACRFDKRGNRVSAGIRQRRNFARQPQHLDVRGELRPAFETVLAGEDKLRIGEAQGRGADDVRRLILAPRMMARNAVERGGLGLRVTVEKILGLLLVLFETGLIG
jgi:hypothetical protein